jgi:hypothetical protein
MAKEQATEQEIESVVHPESSEKVVEIGGRKITVRPLKRGWQKLFDASALPLFTSEIDGPEAVIKAFNDGSWGYTSLNGLMIQSALVGDKELDRVAAIVLAASVEGAEKHVEQQIAKEIEWMQTNTRTEDLWRLVDAQMDKERALMRVGERFPVRFAKLLNLAGIEMTPSTLNQLLTNLQSKLQVLSTGDGTSTTAKPSGSSSDTSSGTESQKSTNTADLIESSAAAQ